MSENPHSFPPMFSFDVSAEPSDSDPTADIETDEMLVTLLRQLVIGQERQNQLLEEMSQQLGQAQKQRTSELGQWKEANPELADHCRFAAETLNRVQTQFLQNLTDEIYENEDCLMDGEFMLNEFVDRYGPRLAHLNGVLQVLSQLSSLQAAANSNSPQ